VSTTKSSVHDSNKSLVRNTRSNGYLYCAHHSSVLSRVLLVLDLNISDLQLVVYATTGKTNNGSNRSQSTVLCSLPVFAVILFCMQSRIHVTRPLVANLRPHHQTPLSTALPMSVHAHASHIRLQMGRHLAHQASALCPPACSPKASPHYRSAHFENANYRRPLISPPLSVAVKLRCI
jgi:hypothetical protein